MKLFARQIEWVDSSKNTLVYKFADAKSGRETFQKSKLIVRESQQAIFVHKGQIADIFTPGTYDLETDIYPILSKLAGWRYGFKTPITVDIYFVNTKQFTDNKWGTSNPIIIKDPAFGPVRVKGYGSYAFKVDDAGVFLKELFGTNSSFETDDIVGWLKTMVVSAMTDAVGESRLSVMDLAGNTMEFNQIIKLKIQEKFNEIGLKLTNLFVENMSVPAEVEKAIDERTKYGVLGDSTDTMMKVAAAEAMKDAAKNQGTGGAFMGMGIGAGAGLEIGKMFAGAVANNNNNNTNAQKTTNGATCPKCGASVSATSKFCPECGEKLNAQAFCTECGAKIKAGSKFCPECGAKQI